MLSAKTHAFTFAVIGDTHVKPETGDQSAPWKVNELATGRARWIAREIERYSPDFVVHLGDLVHPVPELSTFDDAVKLTQNIFKSFHNRLHVIPGNHDIGDKPNRAMPAKMVRDEWIRLYEKNFGPNYHSFDRDGIRFVFINDPVMNSGSEIEKAQRAWLETTLASANGARLFLFMHYPLFLLEPLERENYDNIAEPARSDILSLIRKYRVEAVFAGHVHNIFYHRLDSTEFYVMPATSFVRQDFSEMFRAAAIHENGRNDAEKLGFALVEVHTDGHAVHYMRSYGETLPADEAEAAVAPRSALQSLPHPKKLGETPFGVFLRHPWAEVTALPYNGPMDEFLRKEARNDYPLAALWRLGIRDLRVPVGDLTDEQTRSRMADLVAIGHRFTVLGLGIPTGSDAEAVRRNAGLIDRYECVLPPEFIEAEAVKVAQFRSELGRPVVISPIASSAGEKKVGSLSLHFVSQGFRPDQLSEVERLITNVGADMLAHTVIRVGLSSDIIGVASQLVAWQAKNGCKLDLHLRIAGDNPAVNTTEDAAILPAVVEFYAAALAYPELKMFVDTFMDVDRGYFVRNGLVDRRANLRTTGLAVEVLTAYLGANASRTELSVSRDIKGRILRLTQGNCGALIFLPDAGAAIDVDPRMLDTVGVQSSQMLTIHLDEPWTIQPALGTELRQKASLPKQAARPTMLIGRREPGAGRESL